MKVKFKDNGQVVDVDDASHLITVMAFNEFSGSTFSNRDYMLEYARRAVLLNNEDIRATTADEFVSDLIRYGHIELI